ncbi:PVC-type heme-binding CxxCH protein [Prosthecobacter sp.]|uniref:PVC-type heme-binding CxxCH protein n=1 Tax=Prosthecobacter sp. TaxID=1965333 RepID=UPI002ABA32B8|nr:PVC-type heme-binding CxxCH protein [Prosthecobacter sp.]MDZ4402981.1 PVC-type heme-binding CxxCH protein [Prosthecobacter sp.]
MKRLLLLFALGPWLSALSQLPLELKPGTRIALIGNSLFDRMRDYGQFEALLHQRFAKEKLIVRNLSWSADEVALRPRPDGFGDLNQHLTEHKADVILAAFGFNESFKGEKSVAEFETLLKAFLIELKSHRYNGKTAPQIVLVSPTAAEKPHEHLNAQIKLYTEAMKKVAKAEGVGFADVFTDLAPKTTNGVHLNVEGYLAFGERLYNQLTQETAPKLNEAVRAAVVEKENKFFQHYRPLNYFYIKGGRMEPYGVVNFPGELKKLLQMTEARDRLIWTSADFTDSADLKSKLQSAKSVDDTPLPVITGDRPINEWLSPAAELAAFKIDPRFEVSLFASEEDFPDLFVKPIAIRFDAKGRLWVSTSTTYPQIMPGEAPQDKILILEDTNGDHRADKCRVWADKLAIPLSFEFGNGGVFVSDQPHLTFLKDTDGDGKADHREKLLTGFGTEDSHHALHDFVWSPEGDLIFRESIFHHSQVETPYGPVRARESSFFRYTPATGRLLAFGSYMSTNPWGITFDDWGFHVGSHPVFASAVHALNPPYPDIHIPAGNYFPAYSGTCGQEFLTSSHWPKDLRDKKHFMRVRYKPTNEVELHEWVEHDTHFEEKKVGIVFQSTNLSFIPVDIQQGPDGAMYVADWYNPVKGHMQYSLRDTRRDKKSGRIWRITAKNQKLEEAPKIAGASIPELLDLLKSENYRTRYRAKVELRERQPAYQTVNATKDWLNKRSEDDLANEHLQTELMWALGWSGFLEVYRTGPFPIKALELTTSPMNRLLKEMASPLARAAATRHIRHLRDFINWPHLLLTTASNDPSGLVRLEAAIAASYIGTPEALDAALDLLKHPMDSYLTYALRTSLDSHTLQPLWKGNAAFMQQHPELVKFLEDSEPKKPAQLAKKKKAEKPDPFDAQPGLQTLTIKTIPERLLYDLREFKVKPGAPVKLVFENPDVTPHNLLIVQPGAADEVGMAGNEMAKTPDGLAKGFIPDSPKILHKTKMLNQGDSETLRFTAPSAKGSYPYICTFPGHWLVMKGEMVVE